MNCGRCCASPHAWASPGPSYQAAVPRRSGPGRSPLGRASALARPRFSETSSRTGYALVPARLAQRVLARWRIQPARRRLVGDGGAVAECPDARAPFDAERGVDGNAAALVERKAEEGEGAVGLDAGRPTSVSVLIRVPSESVTPCSSTDSSVVDTRTSSDSADEPRRRGSSTRRRTGEDPGSEGRIRSRPPRRRGSRTRSRAHPRRNRRRARPRRGPRLCRAEGRRAGTSSAAEP